MKNTQDQLIGRWQIVCWKVNAPGGWKSLKKYSDNQFVWDFMANGRLIEHIAGEHPNITNTTSTRTNRY